MAIQIELRQDLNGAEAGLKAQGYHFKEHQHNGLLFQKEENGWLYKAVVDLNGLVRRYRPEEATLNFRQLKQYDLENEL